MKGKKMKRIIILSSISLVSMYGMFACTATGSVTPNPTATVSPTPTATATANLNVNL